MSRPWEEGRGGGGGGGSSSHALPAGKEREEGRRGGLATLLLLVLLHTLHSIQKFCCAKRKERRGACGCVCFADVWVSSLPPYSFSLHSNRCLLRLLLLLLLLLDDDDRGMRSSLLLPPPPPPPCWLTPAGERTARTRTLPTSVRVLPPPPFLPPSRANALQGRTFNVSGSPFWQLFFFPSPLSLSQNVVRGCGQNARVH